MMPFLVTGYSEAHCKNFMMEVNVTPQFMFSDLTALTTRATKGTQAAFAPELSLVDLYIMITDDFTQEIMNPFYAEVLDQEVLRYMVFVKYAGKIPGLSVDLGGYTEDQKLELTNRPVVKNKDILVNMFNKFNKISNDFFAKFEAAVEEVYPHETIITADDIEKKKQSLKKSKDEAVDLLGKLQTLEKGKKLSLATRIIKDAGSDATIAAIEAQLAANPELSEGQFLINSLAKRIKSLRGVLMELINHDTKLKQAH